MTKPQPKILAMFPNQEVMDKEEFLDAFKKVLETIIKKEKKLEDAINEMRATFTNLQNKLGNDHSTTSDKLNRTIAAELESLLRRFSAKSKELDTKMKDIQIARELDEAKVIGQTTEDVLSQIKLPEYKEVILDDAIGLRNKLESLKGKERLTIEAIDGLEKLLEDFKTKLPGRTPFGGSVVHKFFKKTLTADGTTTAFILDKSPTADSLQVFRGGALQEEGSGNDFTLAGKTITFASAPVVGEKLLVYYRAL